MLDAEQQETWFAFMRVMLRMSYEMDHHLRGDSELSLADYHVLNALADSPAHQLALTALAARIGWEGSRVSHHVRRMEARGLLQRTTSPADKRVTHATLTTAGLRATLSATPPLAELVRTLFFDGLDPALLTPLRTALEQVHQQALTHGTLPGPGQPQHRLAGPQPQD